MRRLLPLLAALVLLAACGASSPAPHPTSQVLQQASGGATSLPQFTVQFVARGDWELRWSVTADNPEILGSVFQLVVEGDDPRTFHIPATAVLEPGQATSGSAREPIHGRAHLEVMAPGPWSVTARTLP
jgi:hypothetical protein